MVRIPRILPTQRTITAETPGRLMPISSKGDAMKIMGGTLQEIGDQLKVSNLIIERTRAETQRDKGLLDIESRASQETDLSAAKQRQYDSEIQKVISESSRAITIPAEKSMYELQSRTKGEVSRIRIKGDFAKKALVQGQIEAENYINEKGNEFINAKPEKIQTVLLERNTKFKEFIAAKFMSPQEAIKKSRELNQDWVKRRYENQIETNPELARDNILAGTLDDIYDLTAKEEKELLTLATDLKKKREREVKVQSKVAMQQNEIDMYKGLKDGSKSLPDINDAETRGSIGLEGGISEKVATDLRRLVTKGNTATDLQKANTFRDLYDEYTDLFEVVKGADNDILYDDVKLEGLLGFRDRVIEGMANGRITQATGNEWLKTITVPIKTLEDNPDSGKGWNTLKAWADSFAIQMPLGKLGQELMNKIKSGKDELSAAREVIKEEQKRINPNAGRYEKDEHVGLPTGAWKVVGFDESGDGEPLVVRQ